MTKKITILIIAIVLLSGAVAKARIIVPSNPPGESAGLEQGSAEESDQASSADEGPSASESPIETGMPTDTENPAESDSPAEAARTAEDDALPPVGKEHVGSLSDKENPICLTAEGRIDYFMDEGIIEAQGDVILKWGIYELRAGRMILDLNESFLKAQDKVYFKYEDSGFKSEELTFYFEEYRAIILEPRGTIASDEVKGAIYIQAEWVDASEDLIVLSEGKVSTCDREKPHYYLKTKKLEIWPGDKFTAHHVSFWELSGYLPLLYWPRLTISLQEKEQKITPDIGYSSTRGFFIKTAFNYLKDNYHGLVLLDIYSRTGLAGGIKHYYLDDARGTGYFKIYGQQDWAKIGLPEVETELFHSHNLSDNWQISGQSLLNYHHGNKITANLKSSVRGKGDNLTFSLSGSFNGTRTLKDDELLWPSLATLVSTKINYSWNREKFYLDAQYNNRRRLNQDEFLQDWSGLFRYSGGSTPFSYQLVLERKVPTLGSTTTYHFYRMPEVKISLKPGYFKFNGADILRPISLDFLGGYYDEGKTGHKTLMGNLGLGFSKTWRPLSWLTLGMNQQANAAFYSTGEQLYKVSSRNNINIQPFNFLRTNLTYNYIAPYGETPFDFDKSGSQEDLRGVLYLDTGPWHAQLSSGWDIKNSRYLDVIGQLRFYPGNRLDLRLATGYSIQSNTWRDFVLTGRADYDKLKFTAGYRFAIEPAFTSKRVDTLLSWQIIPEISLRVLTIYDFTKAELTKGEAQVVWDLHCRELVFSYDQLKEEFWVQYHIKAFPGQRLKLGTAPDDPMLFDIDLGDLLPW